MAQTIKTVLINYACCAFFGGILEYIAPQKVKSVLRCVVALVLLFAVASPIVKADIDFKGFNIVENSSETAQMDALMHTANLTEKKIKSELQNILINLEVNEYEIYVNTSVDKEKNTVYLESVIVEVSKEFSDKNQDIYNAITADYKAVLKVGVKNE